MLVPCGGHKRSPCTSLYGRLSLSQLRLSRITSYLEVKLWSLFEHENLTTGNKIMWERGEIAPKEQFLLFSTIFSIYLTSGVKLHSHLWNVLLRFIFSSILQIWFVEVWISRNISECTLDTKIMRVDCSLYFLLGGVFVITGPIPGFFKRAMVRLNWSRLAKKTNRVSCF